jgi:putative Mn2+ efflux pump MntP
VFSVVLIGFSLAMDAFAVSVSSGISIKNLKLFHALRASFFFALFQFAMPVAGWYLGLAFAAYIQAFDHWVAFGLLILIGGKMLFEASKEKEKEEAGGPDQGKDIRSLSCLFLLSVATSIDALAVGLSFSFLDQDIWAPAFLISAITFAVCITGFEFGRRIGVLLEKRAGILGGLILIGIGIKILLEHLLKG